MNNKILEKWTFASSFIFFLVVFSGCSNAPFVQSTDKCDIKRHHKDDIYQVTINGDPINNHYYLKEDAIEIATRLSARDLNKCAPREF